jgi:hypothetical protein
VVAATLLLVPREEAVVRWAAALYLALALADAVVQTPLGDNAIRFGATFAGPVLAIVLLRSRPLALLALALPLLYWQWFATVNDVADGLDNPTAERAYYAGLLAEVGARADPGVPIRLHVPPTRTRWEARFVAERYPLARGWLRQLESDDFELFQEGNLDPEEYASWLYARGVSYVAVTDAEPDYMAADEIDLIEAGGLPFLREVWSDDRWRLFEVRSSDGTRPPPGVALASGGAQFAELRPDGFTVEVPGPGEYLLHARYTPYFAVEQGNACLEDAGDASTRLTATGAGPQRIEVAARLSLEGLLRQDRACSE